MIYDKLLSSDWKNKLVEATNNVINNEYKKYKPFYDFIINFIKKNECLISSLEMLIENTILYNKPLQIYVLNPEEISLKLFKELCKKFGRNFVLRVEVSEKHYSIDYITKNYIRISYINQYKNISLIDYLTPIKVDNLLILPLILELIDLYKKIYNPEYAEEWEELINKSKNIKILTDKNLKKSITSFKGGDNKESILTSIKDLTLKFLEEFSDYILIHKPTKYDSICIMSKNTIKTDFDRFTNYISKYNDFNITFKKKNIFIAKDNRITKYTFFISITNPNEFINKEKPFLDIYNNLSYELVPYTTFDKLKIVHPWVEIRFYYIGIWNILAAFHMKSINYETFSFLTNILLNNIENIKIDWNDLPKTFMGTYINEFQAYKKLMLKHSYNPRIYCS
jgi:hypothetical protein